MPVHGQLVGWLTRLCTAKEASPSNLPLRTHARSLQSGRHRRVIEQSQLKIQATFSKP